MNLLTTFKQFFGFETSEVMEHYNLRSFETFIKKKYGYGVSNLSNPKNTDMFSDFSNVGLSYFKIDDLFEKNKPKTVLPWLKRSNTFLDYYRYGPVERLYNYKESARRSEGRSKWFAH